MHNRVKKKESKVEKKRQVSSIYKLLQDKYMCAVTHINKVFFSSSLSLFFSPRHHSPLFSLSLSLSFSDSISNKSIRFLHFVYFCFVQTSLQIPFASLSISAHKTKPLQLNCIGYLHKMPFKYIACLTDTMTNITGHFHLFCSCDIFASFRFFLLFILFIFNTFVALEIQKALTRSHYNHMCLF